MIKQKQDVIVVGGGLSGVAAAVAAAREGVKVLLVEQYGFLGGMATAGLVNPFMPYAVWKANWQYNWQDKVNQGIFRSILEQLNGLGGLHANNQTFNEELLKLVLDRMVRKNGIKVLYHSFVSAAKREGNRLLSITVTNKSGNTDYEADYFIDASGDADLSALAGCAFNVGRTQDGLCQPMTLCFRLANVDRTKFNWDTDREKINKKYNEFKTKGLLHNPREDVLIFEHMVEDVIHFNSTRVIHKLAINAQELSEAEMEAREQVYELYLFMKENIAGFENTQLLMSASQIGVRESRRIVGEYTITHWDLLAVRKFEDSVARGTYPLDIHNPDGAGSVLKDIPYGDYYTIPYRALLPKGIDNLIVAGRPISSTHEAHSAYRILPICTCIGEGAGTAVSIALKKGLPLCKVNSQQLHEKLDEYGAIY